MKGDKNYLTAMSIVIGTCIGAGVLGIPYVAAQSGFFVALAHIVLIGAIILLVNLYLGEITLRTKEEYQIPGYANKYIGKKGKVFVKFATIFGIYSAIIAYLFGVGESLSFLVVGHAGLTTLFGIGFGLLMSSIIWGGLGSLKRFEKWGVTIILSLLLLIFILFSKNVEFINLLSFNSAKLFLPFGVILFALMSFHAVPEIALVLKKDEKKMKRTLFGATLVSIIFYILFALVVVGFKGSATPEIATLALGGVFIVLGIFTMFTSYLSLGNALLEDFIFDDGAKKFKAWFFTAIIPILLFVFVRMFEFFSFTKILSIGGVVSGGFIVIAILFIVQKAKKNGNRKPEYSIPINWFIIGLLSLIFIAGVVREIIVGLR